LEGYGEKDSRRGKSKEKARASGGETDVGGKNGPHMFQKVLQTKRTGEMWCMVSTLGKFCERRKGRKGDEQVKGGLWEWGIARKESK